MKEMNGGKALLNRLIFGFRAGTWLAIPNSILALSLNQKDIQAKRCYIAFVLFREISWIFSHFSRAFR
jgi:hypothetical protein